MAKIYGQLEKAQLENTTSDTATQPKGLVTYRTDVNKAKVSNGAVMKEIIDEDSTQTLLNKTLVTPNVTGAAQFSQVATPSTPAAGFNKFYYKLDGKLYSLDSAGNESLVGSGGGGGVQNLITNGSADDTAASIFVPYANAASSRPTTGLGGSPTVTTAISSTAPLVGTKHFQLIKPASNVQGQGWAISNIALPLAYRGKSVKSFLEHILDSGTFVPGVNGGTPSDGDAIVYFYDQTNSKLMEPSNIKFFSNSTTISDKYESTVQFDTNCTQVRMIIHVASTSALAWTLNVDNVTLSPQVYVYGTPVTDWSAQETTTGSLTNATYQRKWRREGDSIRERIRIVFSAAPGGTNPLQVDTKNTIDVTKLNTGAIQNTEAIGVAHFIDVSTGVRYTGSVAVGTLSTQIRIQGDSATTGNWGSTNPVTIATGDVIEVDVLYPAAGLSSSVQMSDSADTRIVAAQADVSQTIATGTSVKFTTISATNDTHGGFSTSRYTARVPGYYQFTQNTNFGSSSSAFRAIEYYVNGGGVVRVWGNNGTSSTATSASASFIVRLDVGGYVEFGAFQNTGSNESTTSVLHVARVSGPQAIAASEKIEFSVSQNSGQSIAAGLDIKVIANIKDYDTHNIYNTSTGNFIFPRSGFCTINTRFVTGTIAAGTSIYGQITLYKNNSLYRVISGGYNPNAGTTTYPFGHGSKSFYSLSSDVWDVRVYYGASTSIAASSFENYITVTMR